MPVYNAEKYIKKSVDSVLNQTVKIFELIIIDDCSTDKTVDIINEMYSNNSTIKFYRNEKNMGVSKTRNKGLDLAQGEYVAFLDADDMWYPNKLKYQLAFMQINTHIDFCYTSYDIIDANDDLLRAYKIKSTILKLNSLLKENPIGCSTVFAKAAIFQDNKFKERHLHEDYILWLELCKNQVILHGIPDVLVKYRYQKNSISGNKIKSAKEKWMILRQVEQLNIFKSAYCFILYAYKGLIKYRNIIWNFSIRKPLGKNEA